MPSGSRGGSGGSHGGSRGGGFRSSGSSGHGGSGARLIIHTRTRHSIRLRTRPGAPARYFDLDTLHGVICALITLCFMIFGSMACTNKENIDFLKEDYAYYQNMIVQAELEPDDYIVDAKVTSTSYRADFDRAYINYAIPYTVYEYVPGQGYQDVTKWLYGYSFSVYTQEEAEELLRQGIIKVAVDSKIIRDYTDSIPMDYKDMTIEQDGEYLKALRDEAKSTTILIVLVIVTVGWFAFYIITTKKLSKNFDKNLAEETIAQQKARKTENVDDPNYCEYCGTYMLKDNNIKCPACGATKKIRH